MSSTILPLLVVRRAALPPWIADPADLDTITESMAKLASLRGEATALAGVLSDDLHALVPRLDDRERRRAAVRLRRDIHNGRLTPRTTRDAELLQPVLPPEPAARLDHWSQITRRVHDERDAIDRHIDHVIATRGQAMLSVLKTSELWAGLALASPGYARELARRQEPGTPESRFGRTTFSYATRIAMKTSPFSTFTSLGMGVFDGADVSPDTAVERHLSGPLSLAVELLYACAQDRRFQHAVVFIANPGLRRDAAGGVRAPIPARLCQRGFFLAEDEIVECGDRGEALLRHGDRTGTLDDWSRWLGVPVTVTRRLAATGLLLPVVPWDDPDDAFRGLTDLVRRVPGTAGVSAALSALEATVASVRAPEWRGRVEGAMIGRARAKEAFRELGAAPPHWIEDAPLFHECVGHGGPAVTVPRTVVEDLDVLRERLAAETRRSHLYSVMVADFVSRYGRGGTCPDLLDYLMTFVMDPRFPRVLSELRGQDTRPLTGPRDLRGHGTLGPPCFSVSFQVAAATIEEVRRGAHHTVINRVNSGSGGLLARWAILPSFHDHVRDALSGWFARLHPGCRVVQVSFAEDWAPVQRVHPTIMPVLAWPSRTPGGLPPELTVDMASLALRHDPASDTLQAFLKDTGQNVVFAYTGVVPQYLITGARRILLGLSDPWIPPFWAGLGSEGIGDRRQGKRTEPAFEPRRAAGRLVLRRATWRLPPDSVPLRASGESWSVFIERMTEWRKELSLPERGYVRVFTAADTTVAKPQWIDFRDPWSLSVLAAALPGATDLHITEALPDDGGYCRPGDDGHPRATEFTAFLHLGETGS